MTEAGAAARVRAGGVALLLGLGALGSARAVLASLEALSLPAPTIDVAATEARGATAAPGLPRRRVLVVLVDGLGADAAAAVPEIAALAARGAWVELDAEPPTLSSAQYVAMLTGVAPRDSGVRTNIEPRRTPLATVADVVRARGGRAVEVGDEVDWWGRLFAWDEARVVAESALDGEAARLAADGRNDLVLVHITGVDLAGHARGAASARYRDAAATAGRQIAALAARFAGQGAIVVLSDHGHVARGGHGGAEPAARRAFLAATGGGVRAGARAAGRMVDVAPTLAALLGVPAPAQALGRTLLPALGIEPPVAAALAAADDARLARVGALAAAGRAAYARAERRGRLARGAALLGALAAAAALMVRLGPAARRGGGRGLAGAALAAAALAVVGQGAPSFSGFRHVSSIAFAGALAGALGVAVTLAGSFAAVWRRRAPPDGAWRTAVGAAIGASPAAAAAFVVAGIAAPRFSCQPDWLVAGPPMAYAATAGALTACAALAMLACWRWSRSSPAAEPPLPVPSPRIAGRRSG